MEIKKLNSGSLANFKSLIEIFKDVFENDEPIGKTTAFLSFQRIAIASWLSAKPLISSK